MPDLLDHVTRNWLSHFVTTDLRTYEEIDLFLKRPFFLLVSVDGPLRVRFERERARQVIFMQKVGSLLADIWSQD